MSANTNNPYQKHYPNSNSVKGRSPRRRQQEGRIRTVSASGAGQQEEAMKSTKKVLITFINHSKLPYFSCVDKRQFDIPINQVWKKFFFSLGEECRTAEKEKMMDDLVICSRLYRMTRNAPQARRISGMNDMVSHYVQQYKYKPTPFTVYVMSKAQATIGGEKIVQVQRNSGDHYSTPAAGRMTFREPSPRAPKVQQCPFATSSVNPWSPALSNVPTISSIRSEERDEEIQVPRIHHPVLVNRPNSGLAYCPTFERNEAEDDAMSQISIMDGARERGETTNASRDEFLQFIARVPHSDWTKSRVEFRKIGSSIQFPTINRKLPTLMGIFIAIFGIPPRDLSEAEECSSSIMMDDDDDDDAVTLISMAGDGDENTSLQKISTKVQAYFKQTISNYNLGKMRDEIRKIQNPNQNDNFLSLNRRMPVLFGIFLQFFATTD